MPAPTVESFTVKEVESSSTSIVGNKPAGVVSGDLLVAIYGTDGGGETLSDPGGWTSFLSNNSNSNSFRAWWKIAGGSEPATYTFTVGSSENQVLGLLRISGHDATTPIDITGISTAGSGSPEIQPSVTTTIDNTLVLRIYNKNGPSAFTEDTGYPAGTTGLYNRDTVASGNIGSGVAHEVQATAGATGTSQFTINIGVNDWKAATIAIKPSAGGISIPEEFAATRAKINLPSFVQHHSGLLVPASAFTPLVPIALTQPPQPSVVVPNIGVVHNIVPY